MKLFGWTCPDCQRYFSNVDGHHTHEGVSIRCPDCGTIDRVRRVAGGVA